MVIIYTSKIVFILDSDSENDLSFALMRYYDRKEELKNMFLYILKHLEEMENFGRGILPLCFTNSFLAASFSRA